MELVLSKLSVEGCVCAGCCEEDPSWIYSYAVIILRIPDLAERKTSTLLRAVDA